MSLDVEFLSKKLRVGDVSDDLCEESYSHLIVSTVHRAKGLEFDRVILIPSRRDTDDAAEEAGGVGQRQRPPRLAPGGHREAVIGGQRVDRGARRVDQDRGDRAAIHRRAVDAEQHGEPDDGIEREGGGAFQMVGK